MRCGDMVRVFTRLSVPVMTRLKQDERAVLDTLVHASVARSRSEALAWCVRLVGGTKRTGSRNCARRCRGTPRWLNRVPSLAVPVGLPGATRCGSPGRDNVVGGSAGPCRPGVRRWDLGQCRRRGPDRLLLHDDHGDRSDRRGRLGGLDRGGGRRTRRTGTPLTQWSSSPGAAPPVRRRAC